MKRHHHDPLTPEERDLADRLSRLGPHGGPPPALDAKILAAAHDAVATQPRRGRSRRRWLGVPGGAGGLITGVGLAASLTLVLGVVWQLRPGNDTLPQLHEGPAVEQVILIDGELPSTEPRPRIVEPPPAEDASAPMAGQEQVTSAAPPRQMARQQTAQQPPDEHGERELAPLAAPAPTAPPEPASAAEAVAPDAFPAAPVPAAASAKPVVEPEPAPTRRATYTTAARAQAERAEARKAMQVMQPPTAPVARELDDAGTAAAPAFAPSPQAYGDDAGAGQDTTLDRVEVTGSRLKRTDVASVATIPVHEDSSLAAIDWLQRIRDRVEAGDTDNARESLQRFRKVHPRVRLPDDLQALLRDVEPDTGPERQ